jgi:hypothetical protein
MSALGSFPAVRIEAPGPDPSPPAATFARAQPAGRDVVAALRAAGAGSPSGHVLLIEAHVTPVPGAEAHVPEPALLSAGACVGYPTTSVVTGLVVPRGLRLIQTRRLEAEVPEPALTVPRTMGTLGGNATPQLAFATAFDLARAMDAATPATDAGRRQLALAASIGADALNGLWWTLGTLAALLGRHEARAAWASVAPLLVENADVSRRAREIARLVRLERGIPAMPLDRQQSRALKEMLTGTASPAMWSGFVHGAADLGADGAALARRWGRAASLLWPGAGDLS